MSNIPFYVPRLQKEGAWLDWRGKYNNGYSGFGDRALSEIRFAAPHHSVTNPTGNAKRDVDTLFNIHANNGWNMIGYNFVVTSEEINGFAKVAYVGDLGSVRAHTPNTKGAKGMAAGLGNRYIVAACMIGQNHIVQPTVAQLRSMKLLMQELLFFENDRLPNLWPQWDDMWPHYTWDWTQCNGFPDIRQKIIDVAIPSETPPKPVVKEKSRRNFNPLKQFRVVHDCILENIPHGGNAGTRTYKKGEIIDIAQELTMTDGSIWYRTEYSAKGEIGAGFRKANISEVVAPAPKPEPKPEPAKPVIRALGALMTVKVGKGDKVIDVITGRATREYTQDEPFEATHTIEYNGKIFYMTAFGHQQYLKGNNPTGVDKDTVEAWIIVPTEPDPTPLPPSEEKPETPPELIEQHDKDIADLNRRVSIIEKFIELLKKAWRAIFNKDIGE